MAVSRSTSNGPDWRDAAIAFLDIEKTAGAPVMLRSEVRTKPSRPHFVWIAECLIPPHEDGAPPVLASASVSMITRGGGGTDAALLLLAYELDRDVYRKMTGIAPKY